MLRFGVHKSRWCRSDSPEIVQVVFFQRNVCLVVPRINVGINGWSLWWCLRRIGAGASQAVCCCVLVPTNPSAASEMASATALSNCSRFRSSRCAEEPGGCIALKRQDNDATLELELKEHTWKHTCANTHGKVPMYARVSQCSPKQTKAEDRSLGMFKAEDRSLKMFQSGRPLTGYVQSGRPLTEDVPSG